MTLGELREGMPCYDSQAGPFLAATEEDRAEARRRLPRFSLGDAAALAEALLAVLGEPSPPQPAAFPTGRPGAQQPPELSLLPAPDAPVQCAHGAPSQGSAVAPSTHQLPVQWPPPPSGTVMPSAATALPRNSLAQQPAQPLPDLTLSSPPNAALLPPPGAPSSILRPSALVPPQQLPGLALPSALMATSLPAAYGGYAHSLPLQPFSQPPGASLGATTGSAAPLSVDSVVGLQTPEAGLMPAGTPSHAAADAAITAAASTAAAPLAESQRAAPEQQASDASAPVKPDVAVKSAAPATAQAPVLQQQSEDAAVPAGDGTAERSSGVPEPLARPAAVSEDRAAALSALDRALGIIPPAGALGSAAPGGFFPATVTVPTAAWLPAPPSPAAFPAVTGFGALGGLHTPGMVAPSQTPPAGPLITASAPVGVPGKSGHDGSAALDAEVRRLRADMAERARLHEERERRMAEVKPCSPHSLIHHPVPHIKHHE